MTDSVVQELRDWLGADNISYFRHLKGLTGTYAPVLKLNMKKRGIPAHAVHFREGMQIRNWMRGKDEFKDLDANQLDSDWIKLIEKVCN